MRWSFFPFSKEKHKKRRQAVNSICTRLDQFSDPLQFISYGLFRQIDAAAHQAIRQFPHRMFDFLQGRLVSRKLRAVRQFLEDPERNRARANKIFVANELQRSRKFFDTVETKPLSAEQRRTVVVDEDNNLLIAAAGSGKTAVIVAKAGWLIHKRYRRPSELLLLAYGKDAQKELEQRVKNRLGEGAASEICVRTFHSLGMSIIRQVEGKSPSLAKAAEDGTALLHLLNNIVAQLVADPRHSDTIIHWFSKEFAPYRDVFEFQNFGQYYNYIRSNNIRSLKGEKLKSYEECEIANFLYLNGVRYEYERPYEHETATFERRQYQPDFYLPDAEVYIEHFAINALGEPPSFMDKSKYLRDMDWKRQLHAANSTNLIETFSHEKSVGKLTDKLKEKLLAHGISLSPIPVGEVFDALNGQERIGPFVRLLATFLSHYKGSQLSNNDIAAKAAKQPDANRARAFLRVFTQVFEHYQNRLAEIGQVDFHDMISRATVYAESGAYQSPYRYVLVDEFQDISLGRARLLKALLQNAQAKLFAVGDDWQAIYRFAGSDINVMREFGGHFGSNERLEMGTTFRCNNQIAATAAEFVLKNPTQIVKNVAAVDRVEGTSVHVGISSEESPDILREALDLIAEEWSSTDSRAIVRLLGRYKHSQPKELSNLSRQYPGLQLIFSTIHRSKGLEADYVVVLGLNAGRYGFPSEIADDPVLDLVLAEPEAHVNAEERRLLYVAITRAKHRVFLLAEGRHLSTFAKELLDGSYNVTFFGRSPHDDVACPKCVEGRLVNRKGKHGRFLGCSNWPECDYTGPDPDNHLNQN